VSKILLIGIFGMRKNDRTFITTGEAAKMLQVSLSTAMRFFDMGILTGEKHPITKRRRISRESVTSVMEKYGIMMKE
jgi:hypothetical protein